MKRTSIRCAALALSAVLLAAAAGCQPNPTVPPIVGKGNLESAVVDSTATPPGATPLGERRAQLSAEQGKLNVTVDAALELSGTGGLPVVKVAPRKFTQAEVDAAIHVLFQGKPAYRVKDYLTKDELKKLIIDMKAQLSKMKKDDKGYDSFVSSIQEYEKQVATAPDEETRQISDGKLQPMNGPDGGARSADGGESVSVQTDLGQGGKAILSVFNSGSGRSCSLWFSANGGNDSCFGREYKLEGQPEGVSMTPEEARALAEKTARDLGSALVPASSALGKYRSTLETANGEETGKQAYLFMFTRTAGGAVSTYEENGGGGISQDEVDKMNRGQAQFIEPHPYERIVMAIDDSGVAELQWTAPDAVTETVSENAKILSLDQAVDTFKKQFFLHNALSNRKADETPGKGKMDYAEIGRRMRAQGIYYKDWLGDDKDIQRCSFTIDRIVLGLSRVAVKDKPDEFLLVPVYDFFGSVHAQYTKESGFEPFTSQNAYVSFLTINAIDGSVVDRYLGY